MEKRELADKLKGIAAVEDMLLSDGWKLLSNYIRSRQTNYLKSARDKRSMFNGDKIALFMACEGLCDDILSWPGKYLQNKDVLLEEIMEENK